MRRYSAITASILAVSLALAAHAEDIWKWVDAQGVVHYSDRPVPGAVLVKGNDHTDDAASQSDDQKQLQSSSQQINDQLGKDAAQRKVKQDEADVRAEQCKEAQDRYNKIIHARRVYTTDQNGNRTYLSDDDAQKERVQAELDVQNLCGSDSSE